MRKTFVLNDDVVLRVESDEEALLVDRKQSRYYLLNTTAVKMLSVLLKHGDEERCTDEISKMYLVDRITVARDLQRMVDHLRSLGILSVRE